MAGPDDPNENTADMDNPQMMFTGSWTKMKGPSNCEVDNDSIATTSEVGATMSWPFEINDNVLDIIGGSLLTSGANVRIQIDSFQTTVDTSLLGSFPLVDGATDQNTGQCSYLASIGPIKPGVQHNITITHEGPGKNVPAGQSSVLTLSTLNWRQNNSVTSLNGLQLLSLPSTNFPSSTPPSSSTSAASSPPTSTPSVLPVPSASHSSKTLGLAIGIAVMAAVVLGVTITTWICFRRRNRRAMIRKRGIKIISPPDSLHTSFSSMVFEKQAKPQPRPIAISTPSPTRHRPESIASQGRPHSYILDSSTPSRPSYPPPPSPLDGSPQPAVRRVSRKPVPRPTTAERGEESGDSLPLSTPTTPAQSRPDSDTLVNSAR